MFGLNLNVQSFTDMTLDRAVEVARTFDAFPRLRPVKVGGDPARIKVEPSMAAVVAKHGLPIEWLTVRRNGRYPDFEGGEIDLHQGRGSWGGTPQEFAEDLELGGPNHIGGYVFHLSGHRIEQSWLPATLNEPGLVDQVVALFERLLVATDAAYGNVDTTSARSGPIDRKLPGVYWLNYFGPAFVAAFPALNELDGGRAAGNGGVLVQTTEEPQMQPVDKLADWQLELRRLLGEGAFTFVKPNNPALPSIEDHLAASPGTLEMPWIAWLEQKDGDRRTKRHAGAKKRLAAALEGRPAPMEEPDVHEWSTSFDLDDFPEFFTHLKRRLGGELSARIGSALKATIENAFADDEAEVVLQTKLGVVRIGWFIDDPSTVDLYVFGSPAVQAACEAWFE